MPALTTPRTVFTNEHEIDLAHRVLERLDGTEGYLAVGRGDDVRAMPSEVGRILQLVVSAMSRGEAITVGSVPEELTTSSAAGILGVSRPTVMKMVADGVLDAHKVGTHTRLRRDDVLDQLKARRTRERAAFQALLELEGDDD